MTSSRRPKRITDAHITGEAGVGLIALRTAEMGHIWHQRQTDAGIDGEIELRDADGTVRNLVVMVQSKASDRPFPGETDHSFHFVVDQRDLDYWLGGNAPVILVCSHPRSGQAWWAHLNAWFDDPARRESRRVVFDKAAQAFDKDAAEAVARLAAPAGSGIYLGAPPRSELIRSNLLPLIEAPAEVYRVPVTESRADRLGPALRDAGVRRSDWILSGGHAYCLRDFDEKAWDQFLEGPVSTEPMRGWLDSDDPATARLCAQLLTRTLLQDLHYDVAWHGKKRLLYFRATRDLRPRKLPGKARERTVFKGYPNKKDADRVAYYRHDALRLGYLHEEGQWHAQLEPTYLFTSDGYLESLYAADNLAGIRRLERAAAVEGSLSMWAAYLRGDKQRLGDPDRRLRFGDLVTFEADHGVDDRHWIGKPKADDDGTAPAPQDLSDWDEPSATDVDADALDDWRLL